MAYSIVRDDILELQIVGRLHGQETRNTFHYYYDGPLPYADGRGYLEALLTRFDTMVYGPLMDRISNEWTLTALTAQKIDAFRYRMVTNPGSVEGGQVTGNSLPSYCAVVISRFAEIATHEGQGRIFIPGIPAADERDSELSDAAFALWLSIPGLLNTTLNPTVGGPAVPTLSRTQANARRQEVIQVQLRKILRAQRRREVGRGS